MNEKIKWKMLNIGKYYSYSIGQEHLDSLQNRLLRYQVICLWDYLVGAEKIEDVLQEFFGQWQ